MGTEDQTPVPTRSAPAPRAPTTPAMPAGKDTVENWARAKGMLHEFSEGELDATRAKKYPKAKKPLVHNKAHAPFRAAKASLQWPVGMEVTEDEFDKAIALNGGPPVKDVTPHIYR
jgi:hypothetical protein